MKDQFSLFHRPANASVVRQISLLIALIGSSLIMLFPRASVADPASLVGNLVVSRYAHRATLLLDGRVLVEGGNTDQSCVTPTAELYDPTTKSRSLTGNLNVAREIHGTV